MVQGDRYSLPIKILTKTKGSSEQTVVTNENIARVRIRLGDVEDVYPGGTLLYDEDTERWLLPLTQEQTLKMYTNVMLQVRLVFPDGSVYNSRPRQQNVYGAIIREVEPYA